MKRAVTQVSMQAMLNGVMVALQILVLSVWVRVLVEQQRKVSSWGLFLLQRDSHPGSYLTTFERLISKLIFRVLVEQQKETFRVSFLFHSQGF